MRPIYELVTAAELKVGDVVLQELDGVELSLLPSFFWEGIDESERYFRRLPATEDPRVLRRVAELLAGWYANETGSDAKKELDGAIEQAVMELESEGTK